MSDLNQPPGSTRERSLAELTAAAMVRLAGSWLVLLIVITAATMATDVTLCGPSIWIAIGSLLIAVFALSPGVFIGRAARPPADMFTTLYGLIVAAMGIRALGTVALFLLCRYQMGLSLHTLAMFVCGWYALLTSIEVALLAHNAKSLS